MKYLSVCSGIEAATTAWHPLGWEPVGFSEIEPFPSQVLAHHYPTVKNYGDMTQHEAWDIKPGSFDLLVGGCPCQSFSVAGLRQGLKDPRGNLSLTYLAIAARLRPRWIVWENVPGVLSSSGGRDLASFLGALGNLGYGWAYRVLDAQWVRSNRHSHAVPQRRRRIFVVGHLGDPTAAATVLFERQSLLRDSKKSAASRQDITGDVEASTRGGCWWDGGDAADTLTKCGANGAQRMPDKDNFGALLQVSTTLRAKAAASHRLDTDTYIPVPIQDGREINKQQNGIGVGQPGDPAYTLDTTGAQSVYTKAKRAQSDTDDETWVEGQVNPTLSLFDCGDVRATTVAIQGNLIGRDKGGPQGVGASTEGAMYTMTKADVHGVAIAFHPTQDPISSTDGSVHAMGCGSSGGCATQAVAQAMTVRRLTPRECERLQGFPDDYTLIPWRKKAAEDCPDGPRYKALGNSMAVNCMEWIGERIAAFEAKQEP